MVLLSSIVFRLKSQFRREKWDPEIFNDVLLVDYPDGQTAIENYLQIMEIWEEALQEETPSNFKVVLGIL